MMPLTEAGAPAQGGGPAGMGLLKIRASRRGETSRVLEDRKSRGRRWRLPRQESFLHGLCRPLRPHPGFGESDSAELASLHLLPRTRSARRNYRIAGARLMRSNYPPPLSSAALCCAGPTRPN
ncbi:LOW QUALITY PROTEIN: uncharacterized protein C6orf223 homolog [Enhydra lutris kenyoni]|uniref:LOW QUALITY PROTEIN: uncharacterized protein C6orf223 homolog n=1 Tax=Enhydra lutris kenyoni TaxID=391180 RepID=A0A2Y9JJ69_ENHLU|nr:LOW QUALITY PROTEIN: uncharacterized protein C6orf223 homolog [Enhydra lutris kenyoni]